MLCWWVKELWRISSAAPPVEKTIYVYTWVLHSQSHSKGMRLRFPRLLACPPNRTRFIFVESALAHPTEHVSFFLNRPWPIQLNTFRFCWIGSWVRGRIRFIFVESALGCASCLICEKASQPFFDGEERTWKAIRARKEKKQLGVTHPGWTGWPNFRLLRLVNFGRFFEKYIRSQNFWATFFHR
jgi:hypothetical protein